MSDLPVGQGLQNHVAVNGILATIANPSPLEIPNVKDVQSLMEWYRTGEGPFSSPAGTHLGVGFFNVVKSISPPQIEIMLIGVRDTPIFEAVVGDFIEQNGVFHRDSVP